MPTKIHPFFAIVALVVVASWALDSFLFPDIEGLDAAPLASSDGEPWPQRSVRSESSTHSQRSSEQPGDQAPAGKPSASAAEQAKSADQPTTPRLARPQAPPQPQAPQPQAPAQQQGDGEPKARDAPASPPREPLLAISGRVLTDAGAPLSGVEVVVLARQLFAERGDAALGFVGDEQRTWSGLNGSYQFAQLAEGEYEIRNQPKDHYETVRRIVRAGTHSADLVLADRREVWVHGTVRSGSNGRPLADVLVTQSGRSGGAYTDSGGNYELSMAVDGLRRSYLLLFSRQDYETNRITLREEEVRGQTEIRLDAELEQKSEQEVARVTGEVKGAGEGRPVAGAGATLRSARQNRQYQAVTNGSGVFVFPEVATANDYVLRVQPRDSYKDAERRVRVTSEGLQLAIELEPLDTDSLAGRLVDPQGRPIPGFNLWLRSANASARPSIPVRSDPMGNFSVNEAPQGALILQTLSSPNLRVSIPQSRAPNQKVQLPLDWGDRQLRGQVVDGQGRPVAGSRVQLYWSLYGGSGGVSSSSSRSAITDVNGYFQFTNLGSGTHTLEVEAPGYKKTRLENQASTVGHVRVTLREAS